MKKIFTALLIAALAAATFTGCSSNNSNSNSSAPSTSSTASTASDASTNSTESAGSQDKITGTVNVVTREQGSGTRDAFTELTGVLEKGSDGSKTDKTFSGAVTLNGTQAVMSNVSGDKAAIGYISLGSVNDTVKAVKIEGVAPSTATVKDGTYKLQRPFNIVTKSGLSEVAQDFVNYIMSADGQKVIEDNKYVSIDSNAKAYEGKKPSGTITIDGSTSVGPVMEKLKEAYAAVNPNATIQFQTSDSSTGISSAINGSVDIGMSSRDLKDTETGVTATKIALDGIAVIVNKENTTDDLTIEQIKKIYTGEVTDWGNI
ncbi:MAG: extracellular solute-binding protein [Clostridia bacterium]|nr:extracellular solute-binding protein [Clostridia bacterium]